jgi:hypothetical protein
MVVAGAALLACAPQTVIVEKTFSQPIEKIVTQVVEIRVETEVTRIVEVIKEVAPVVETVPTASATLDFTLATPNPNTFHNELFARDTSGDFKPRVGQGFTLTQDQLILNLEDSVTEEMARIGAINLTGKWNHLCEECKVPQPSVHTDDTSGRAQLIWDLSQGWPNGIAVSPSELMRTIQELGSCDTCVEIGPIWCCGGPLVTPTLTTTQTFGWSPIATATPAR